MVKIGQELAFESPSLILMSKSKKLLLEDLQERARVATQIALQVRQRIPLSVDITLGTGCC
jgi:hypothetical protein